MICEKQICFSKQLQQYENQTLMFHNLYVTDHVSMHLSIHLTIFLADSFNNQTITLLTGQPLHTLSFVSSLCGKIGTFIGKVFT